MHQRNNVIAVASGKGGVGKTWFSVTLAQALAGLGQRSLLFDGDFGLANVDIQLGLAPRNDLSGVVSGKLTLNQVVHTFDDGGFDVIAGRSGSEILADIAPNRLHHLSNDLLLLATAYDQVIVDLGAGVNRSIRHLAHRAGTCLVVTSDDPSSLTDAYAFIKTARAERPDLDLRLVINMCETIRDGERTYNTLRKACEGFLKYSPLLAGVVRWDNHVRSCIRQQQAVLSAAPTCDAAQDVLAIARSLLVS